MGPPKFAYKREAIPIILESFLNVLDKNVFVHGVFWGLRNTFKTIFSGLKNPVFCFAHLVSNSGVHFCELMKSGVLC